MRASTHAIAASGATGGIDFRQSVTTDRLEEADRTRPASLGTEAAEHSLNRQAGGGYALPEVDAEGISLLSTAKARSGKARPAKRK